jgi:hypothetical protein
MVCWKLVTGVSAEYPRPSVAIEYSKLTLGDPLIESSASVIGLTRATNRVPTTEIGAREHGVTTIPEFDEIALDGNTSLTIA